MVRLSGPRQAAALGLVSAVLLAAVASQAACGGGSSKVPLSAESIALGTALFEANCQVCHGLDGRGSELAPDLTVHIPTRTDDFMFGRISEGFNSSDGILTMQPFEDVLSETERWHLVNVLRDAFGTLTFITPEAGS